MKKLIALMLCLVLVFSFAACAAKNDVKDKDVDTEEKTDASEKTDKEKLEEAVSGDGPIVIGWVGPLTGTLAFTGNQTYNATCLAAEKVGTVLGREVIVEAGDATDAASAVSEFERLYEKGVRLFIGSYGSFADYAIQALVDENDALLITASGWADDFTEKGYKNYFHFTPRVKIFGDKMAEYIPVYAEMAGIEEDEIRVALFGSANYEYVLNDTRESLKAAGINVVVDEVYAADRSDFSALIAAFQSNKVNVLVPAQGSADGPTFVKQMAEMGYKAPLQFAMGLFYDQTDFQQLGNELTNGWMVLSYTHTYINPDCAEGITEFRESFEEEFGNTPLTHATQTYSATLFLCDMIEQAGTDEVYAVIDQIRSADIPKGTYPCYWGIKFDETGKNLGAGDPLAIGQWQDGSCVVVGTDEIKVGDPILPVR